MVDRKLLDAAYADGFAAFNEGRHFAPSLSPLIHEMTEGMAVGDGAGDIYQQFSNGWQDAMDAECARILAED